MKNSDKKKGTKQPIAARDWSNKKDRRKMRQNARGRQWEAA